MRFIEWKTVDDERQLTLGGAQDPADSHHYPYDLVVFDRWHFFFISSPSFQKVKWNVRSFCFLFSR